jgi:hypothetical protein
LAGLVGGYGDDFGGVVKVAEQILDLVGIKVAFSERSGGAVLINRRRAWGGVGGQPLRQHRRGGRK